MVKVANIKLAIVVDPLGSPYNDEDLLLGAVGGDMTSYSSPTSSEPARLS
jgi:hypothetical protein